MPMKRMWIIDLLCANQNDKSLDAVGNAGKRFVIGKEKVNNKAKSFKEAEEFDRRYYAQMTPEER